jgi:hypothetical protein
MNDILMISPKTLFVRGRTEAFVSLELPIGDLQIISSFSTILLAFAKVINFNGYSRNINS